MSLVEDIANLVHGTSKFSGVVSIHVGATCERRRRGVVPGLVNQLLADHGCVETLVAGDSRSDESIPRGTTYGVDFALKLHFLGFLCCCGLMMMMFSMLFWLCVLDWNEPTDGECPL